jgi:hypothetical protein
MNNISDIVEWVAWGIVVGFFVTVAAAGALVLFALVTP